MIEDTQESTTLISAINDLTSELRFMSHGSFNYYGYPQGISNDLIYIDHSMNIDRLISSIDNLSNVLENLAKIYSVK